jgi:hypothetical protein
MGKREREYLETGRRHEKQGKVHKIYLEKK